MSCQKVIELLMEYVSHEMSDGHRAMLDEHFRYCPPCQAYLHSYQATIRMSGQLPKDAPLPPEMEARLKDVLRRIQGQ